MRTFVENVSKQPRSFRNIMKCKEPPLVSLHLVTAALVAEHLTIKLESMFKALSGRT